MPAGTEEKSSADMPLVHHLATAIMLKFVQVRFVCTAACQSECIVCGLLFKLSQNAPVFR